MEVALAKRAAVRCNSDMAASGTSNAITITVEKHLRKRMTRHIKLFATLIVVLVVSSSAQAQKVIFWQGGPGVLTDSNYSDGTNPNIGPGSTDYLNIGNGGVVTFSSSAGFGRLRVGHNQAPGGQGAGTLTVSGAGNLLELTLGAAAPNGGIWVGNTNDGLVNVQDGAELKSSRLVVVGAGDSGTATGTMNIKTGGILTVSDGNLSIGDRAANGENGEAGVVNLSDAASSIAIKGAGADMAIGSRARPGTYNQTDGTVTINDTVDLAPQTGSSVGSTFSISGGTLTTGVGTSATAGNFFMGRGASVGATVNISGTAILNVGNRFLMGGTDAATTPTAIASGVVVNQSGGTLNTDLDLRVADAFISPTSDATYNFSGGVINSTTGGLVGRQGTGKFIQTGGTANFNGTVSIGNRETVTTTTANGLYKISAGALNITGTAPTPPATQQVALNIAPNGTGEFRVVGDDATIALTGDLIVNSTANGTGKLAFELEGGDLLSQISVTGNATFNASSILAFDTTNASPTQASYNLLTAASITNSGLVFSGPSGWTYQIVAGGNGQILQAVQGGPVGVDGDYNNNGVVDAADYVLWRNGGPLQNEVDNPGTVSDGDYTAWRARFGKTTNGAGSGTQVAAVPEPVSFLLWVSAAVAMATVRRRGA